MEWFAFRARARDEFPRRRAARRLRLHHHGRPGRRPGLVVARPGPALVGWLTTGSSPTRSPAPGACACPASDRRGPDRSVAAAGETDAHARTPPRHPRRRAADHRRCPPPSPSPRSRVGPGRQQRLPARRRRPALLLVDAADDARPLLDVLGDRPLDTDRHHPPAPRPLAGAGRARPDAARGWSPAARTPRRSPTGRRADRRTASGTATRSPLGDEHLDVVGLVGHTPGSIVLAYRGPDGPTHLFTGDSLFPGGARPDLEPGGLRLADGRPRGARSSAASPTTPSCTPGHGDDTTLGTERPHLASGAPGAGEPAPSGGDRARRYGPRAARAGPDERVDAVGLEVAHGDPDRRAGALAEPPPRRHRPARGEQVGDDAGLVGDRDPDVQAGRALAGRPGGRQRVQQGRAAGVVRVAPPRRRPRRPPGRTRAPPRPAAAACSPSPNRSAADPRPGRPSPRRRPGRPGAGPGRTAWTATGRTPTPPSPRPARQRDAGQLGGVVVLDDQHLGVGGEHPAQRGGPLGGDVRAGRVLGAGGDDDRAGAVRAGPRPATPGTGPPRSTATGSARRPAEASRSSRFGQPGSSTATASPGDEPGGQHPADRVQPAPGQRQVRRLDAVGREPVPGQVGERGQHQRVGRGGPRPARAGRGPAAAAASAAGWPGREVDDARPAPPAPPLRAPSAGRARTARAVAAVGLDQPALRRRAVGAGDGAGCDAELVGERPDGGHEVAGDQPAVADRRLERGEDLGCRAPGQPITFCHNQRIVLDQSSRTWRPMTTDTYTPTARTTPTRLRERVAYDREAVHAALDEAVLCHVAFVADGAPVVLPQLHVRVGETLYLHGSTGARAMRESLADGLDVCVDRDAPRRPGAGPLRLPPLRELPLRRRARPGPPRHRRRGEGRGAAAPRRRDRPRPLRPRPRPSRRELAATAVLRLDLDGRVLQEPLRAARRRRGGPRLPWWAGVLPLRSAVPRTPPAPDLTAGIEVPAHVSGWSRG